MTYWNPLQDHQETWMPVGGWNVCFSTMDQIQCRSLFFHCKKKGCTESVASCLAQMVLYKQQYGVRYSEEQEAFLKRMMSPITH
jgi:hypothetical protein